MIQNQQSILQLHCRSKSKQTNQIRIFDTEVVPWFHQKFVRNTALAIRKSAGPGPWSQPFWALNHDIDQWLSP